jgi:quercetin dioxygenase-like cupin family protein
MKRPFAILAVLLLVPADTSAQQPPGAAAPPAQAVRRGWETAPAEKRALWREHQQALVRVDLADDTARQVFVARGGPGPEEYHAHPTTALLADGKTIYCVWNIGHGGHAGPGRPRGRGSTAPSAAS